MIDYFDVDGGNVKYLGKYKNLYEAELNNPNCIDIHSKEDLEYLLNSMKYALEVADNDNDAPYEV